MKAKTKTMVSPGSVPKGTAGALRAFALAYPGAHEEFPWGERVVKVKGKVFAPVEVLLAWIDESYRAVAPKTLVGQLDARAGGA